MSRWAVFLLVTYVSLGLSRMSPSRATRVALLVTTLVLAIVMANTGTGT